MIQLEHLADGSISDRNFQKLTRLVPDTGGTSVAIRFGVAALTWPGGTPFSNQTAITHGLGKTPLGVLATGNLGGLSALAVWTETPGPDTFVLQGWNPAGSPGGGAVDAVFWVAIG